MKIFRSFIITGAIALVMISMAGSHATAQTKEGAKELFKNSTPEQRADTLNKLMRTELHLNAGQYEKVGRLNLEYARQMQAVIDSDDSRMSKAYKAKSILTEKDKKLKAIFTPGQYDKYQQYIKAKVAELKKQYKG